MEQSVTLTAPTHPVPSCLMRSTDSLAAILAAIEAVADALPGVLIVNRIPDGSPEYLSPRGRQLIGVTLDEITAMSGEEYHSRFFNSVDEEEFVSQVMNLVARNEPGTLCTYFQQVRTRAGCPWEWYSVGTTVFLHDNAGQPTHLLTFAMPVDPRTDLDAKVERLLAEKTFRRKHAVRFASLTRRERDVLRLLALGHSAQETAEELRISVLTAETHRRNLRGKLGVGSGYDLVQFAQAFDLI